MDIKTSNKTAEKCNIWDLYVIMIYGAATNSIADLALIFTELLKGEPAEEKHLVVVGHNCLSVNPSSLLSLNHSVFTLTATHTHTLLTPLPCPQQPTHSGRLTVLAQGPSEGVLAGSASSGF